MATTLGILPRANSEFDFKIYVECASIMGLTTPGMRLLRREKTRMVAARSSWL